MDETKHAQCLRCGRTLRLPVCRICMARWLETRNEAEVKQNLVQLHYHLKREVKDLAGWLRKSKVLV